MPRRMFSPDIVESDAFLDMPPSSQALYFHLGMYADDDGFVNPKRIMRMSNSSDDDLKVLISKRFVLPFKSGVVVIKHWRINNLIRSDRYHQTRYLEERKTLRIKKNDSYTEWQPNGNQRLTEVRLGKVRLGKVRLGNIAETGSAEFSFNNKLLLMDKDKNIAINIIAQYWRYNKITFDNYDQYQSGLKRDLRAAAALKGYPIERIKEVMYYLNGEDFLTDIWSLETVNKYIHRDLTKLNEKNYEKPKRNFN